MVEILVIPVEDPYQLTLDELKKQVCERTCYRQMCDHWDWLLLVSERGAWKAVGSRRDRLDRLLQMVVSRREVVFLVVRYWTSV